MCLIYKMPLRNYREERPYGIQIFDDLHNYLPNLLYNPQQFNSAQDIVSYISSSAQNIYNHNIRAHAAPRTPRTPRENDLSDDESIEQNMNQTIDAFIDTFLNTLSIANISLSDNIRYSIIHTTIPIHAEEEQVLRPTTTQISRATQRLTTTHAQDICSICHDLMDHSDIRRIIHCQHTFHQRCIDRWFEENPHCPVCRYDIRTYTGN